MSQMQLLVFPLNSLKIVWYLNFLTTEIWLDLEDD